MVLSVSAWLWVRNNQLLLFVSAVVPRILFVSSLWAVGTSAFSLSMMSSSSSSSSSSNAPPPRPSSITTPKNIVVIGGGIQGTSVAYQIVQRLREQQEQNASSPPGTAPSSFKTNIVILEAKATASAASGKGGGFMARSWGNGSPTHQLHELAFDMYETLAPKLGCTSYRKLPVLSVSAGYNKGIELAKKSSPDVAAIIPNWLDGDNYGRLSAMGYGTDTAQITPSEFVEQMLEQERDSIQVILGTCTGMETEEEQGSERGSRKIVGVKYLPRGVDDTTAVTTTEEQVLPADVVIVSAGPWSCAAEDWFPVGAIELPMEGIKSTSIVWNKPETTDVVDATALFCGEDDRHQTHLEVYPRPDGTIYICGIGGSDYISKEDLKQGACLEVCDAQEARVQAAKSSFQEMSSLFRDNGTLNRVQACMRPCPPDGLPYMGRIPGYEGAYINAGHNCWGIAWAPATGKAMAELVLDGQSKCINLQPFSPARFTTVKNSRGGRGRKKQGDSVGEQW